MGESRSIKGKPSAAGEVSKILKIKERLKFQFLRNFVETLPLQKNFKILSNFSHKLVQRFRKAFEICICAGSKRGPRACEFIKHSRQIKGNRQFLINLTDFNHLLKFSPAKIGVKFRTIYFYRVCSLLDSWTMTFGAF